MAVNKPTLKDVINSLLIDASFADYSLDDFMGELGYDDRKIASNFLKACKKNKQKLQSIFSKNEIEQLQKTLENY